MMILKLKYAFAIFTVLLGYSGWLYAVTGKTECFWYILSGLTSGAVMGGTLFYMATHYGNKVYNKILLKRKS